VFDYLTFIRLTARRLRSTEDYLAWQRFQAEQVVWAYLRRRIAARLEDFRVLDLGCGYGGYSQLLAEKMRLVVGLDDAMMPQVSPIPGRLAFIRADATAAPFGDGDFDLVICSSLLEHVPEPRKLLAEVVRLLRPGGWCYLSFPPYYSPWGGHQFAPFHLLGEGPALRLYRLRHRDASDISYAKAFGSWGLYKRTIKGTRRLLGEFPLQVRDISSRWLPVNTAKWPVLGEFLTWHVQFLLQKVAS